MQVSHELLVELRLLLVAEVEEGEEEEEQEEGWEVESGVQGEEDTQSWMEMEMESHGGLEVTIRQMTLSGARARLELEPM